MSGAPENSEAIRAFLALPVPHQVIEKLQAAQRSLREVLAEVSWARPDQQHLTLRFYGNVSTSRLCELQNAIQRVCERTKPFRLCAEGLGLFGDRVLWVGVTGALQDLNALETQIAQATRGFGEAVEPRPFHPHLTLGRFKTRRPARGALADIIRDWSGAKFGEWTVDRVELMRSDLLPQGARHSCLATLVLAERGTAAD